VNVTETAKGFWRVLISLHGAAAVPNGPFTTLWQWYTRTTVFVVILSIVTGVYIWIAGKDEKKTGLLILLTSMSAAILWMIKLYFWG
jgi:hypothetical protein